MIQPKVTRQSGMTLLEVAMGATFLAFIGYILTTTVQISTRTHSTVMENVSDLGDLRSSSVSLRAGLRMTSEDLVVITELASGDSEMVLQEPITVGGKPAWGVYEVGLGTDEDSRTKEDWLLRFTVSMVAEGNGGIRHDLVRQVLDTVGTVHLEETLVSDLFQGDAADPGFRVQDAGDVWEVSIQTAGITDTTKGPSITIHARTRN